MSEASVEAAEIPTTGGTRVARITLIVIGGLGTLLGLYILLTTVKPQGLLGLGVWLFAALLLHDGILSPTLFLAQRALHRVGSHLSGGVLALIQAGVLVGGIITLVVVPEIMAQARGPRNPSVLNMDYGLHLFLAWIVITVIVVVGIVSQQVRGKRQVTAAPTASVVPAATSRVHVGAVGLGLLIIPSLLLVRRIFRRR